MGPLIWLIFRDDSKIDFWVVFMIKRIPTKFPKSSHGAHIKFNFSMGSHSFQFVS
jgi:hypothetical protein